jgi:putative DNA primase/helicase
MNTFRRDMSFVRAALAARAAELAVALLGEPNRAMSSKREVRFGRHGSLAVLIAGPKAGLWRDHEVGTGGDMLGLIMTERGGGFRDAVEYAEQFLGQAPRPLPITKPKRPVASGDTTDSTRRALELWEEAVPIAGTIAERYLLSPPPRGRGIPELAPGIDGEALRFHARYPWRDNEGDTIIKVPALIGLFRDIHTDEPRAIHLRALTSDGQKIGKPRARGPKTGCAIKFSPDTDVADHLTVGEGCETVLSGMALGYSPAWALGDTAGLKTFPLLSGVESTTILVDHDENQAGQDAALKCSARWTGAGREVFRFVPRQVGADVNDVLIGRRRTAE